MPKDLDQVTLVPSETEHLDAMRIAPTLTALLRGTPPSVADIVAEAVVTSSGTRLDFAGGSGC